MTVSARLTAQECRDTATIRTALTGRDTWVELAEQLAEALETLAKVEAILQSYENTTHPTDYSQLYVDLDAEVRALVGRREG